MRPISGDDEIEAFVRGYADTPGHLIRRVHQAYTQLWAEVVPVGITGSQYSILSALSTHGALDQVTVGRLTSLDKSSVAELSSRMAQRGLLQRSKDERDGRKRLLRITEDGVRTMTEAAPYVHRLGQRLLAPLDEGERVQFMDYMRRVGDLTDRER